MGKQLSERQNMVNSINHFLHNLRFFQEKNSSELWGNTVLMVLTGINSYEG